MVLATIYLIVVGEEAYVGSTTQSLNCRISTHMSKSNTYGHRKLYNAIENIGGWENVDIVILQEYESTCKNNILLCEKMWIQNLNTTLNTYTPYQTHEERLIQNQNYENNNREMRIQKNRKWRKNNIEKERERDRNRNEYKRKLYHQKNRG